VIIFNFLTRQLDAAILHKIICQLKSVIFLGSLKNVGREMGNNNLGALKGRLNVNKLRYSFVQKPGL